MFLLLLLFWAPSGAVQFDRADARILVTNAPRVVGLVPERCMFFEDGLWPDDERVIVVKLYNKCSPGGGSSSVGLYFVDLRTGQVRPSVPDAEPEESQRLKDVRASVLRKKKPTKKK